MYSGNTSVLDDHHTDIFETDSYNSSIDTVQDDADIRTAEQKEKDRWDIIDSCITRKVRALAHMRLMQRA